MSSSFWASVLYIVSVAISISLICVDSFVIGQVLVCIYVVVDFIIIMPCSVVVPWAFSCVVSVVIVAEVSFSKSPPLDHT
jgi:hypothetical protein